MSENVHWLAQHVEEDGVVAFRVGRLEGAVIAEWVGVARLVARLDGTDVRFSELGDADPRQIEKIRLGSSQLLLRALHQKIALHGGAVAFRDRSIVLLGRSGQGKSTLVARLCQDSRFSFLADDAVAIDRSQAGYLVVPLERNHWLDETARAALRMPPSADTGGKLPICPAASRSVPTRLAAFVELSYVDGRSDVRLTPIAGVEAMAALVPQSVRFVLDDPVRHKQEFDVLSTLIDHVPFFRLERPRALTDVLLASASRHLRALMLDEQDGTMDGVSP